MRHLFDWSYAGRRLCSACGPTHYRDGKRTEFGKWHGVFSRDIFPIGEFFTNDEGSLQHRDTGLLSGKFAKQYPHLVTKL